MTNRGWNEVADIYSFHRKRFLFVKKVKLLLNFDKNLRSFLMSELWNDWIKYMQKSTSLRTSHNFSAQFLRKGVLSQYVSLEYGFFYIVRFLKNINSSNCTELCNIRFLYNTAFGYISTLTSHSTVFPQFLFLPFYRTMRGPSVLRTNSKKLVIKKVVCIPFQ